MMTSLAMPAPVARHQAPLVSESRAYLLALGEGMEVLTTAERETEY
jgi:hypothetical protein